MTERLQISDLLSGSDTPDKEKFLKEKSGSRQQKIQNLREKRAKHRLPQSLRSFPMIRGVVEGGDRHSLPRRSFSEDGLTVFARDTWIGVQLKDCHSSLRELRNDRLLLLQCVKVVIAKERSDCGNLPAPASHVSMKWTLHLSALLRSSREP